MATAAWIGPMAEAPLERGADEMNEEDRIRDLPCGCRVDIVTDLRTFLCAACARKAVAPFSRPRKTWPAKDYLASEK